MTGVVSFFMKYGGDSHAGLDENIEGEIPMNVKHCHRCYRSWPHERDGMCIVRPCATCGDPAAFEGAHLCTSCWEVERRLEGYLMAPKGVDVVLDALAQRFRTGLKMEAEVPAPTPAPEPAISPPEFRWCSCGHGEGWHFGQLGSCAYQSTLAVQCTCPGFFHVNRRPSGPTLNAAGPRVPSQTKHR